MRFKYIVVIACLAITGILWVAAPPLDSVTNDDQIAYFNEHLRVVKGYDLEKRSFPGSKANGSMTIVFSRDGKGEELGRSDYRYMARLEKWLNDKEDGPGSVVATSSPVSMKDLGERLISSDGKVAIVSVDITQYTYRKGANTLVDKVRSYIAETKPRGAELKVNVSGDGGIGRDYTKIDEKSTVITALLVVMILLFVFKSPVTPIIPLVTIGLSYLSSVSAVSLAAEAGMGVSSYTGKFLTAIIFGAGTDYCLFVISRYRELLNSGATPGDSVVLAMGAVGEAIASSAATVIIGFLSMLAATFGLFRDIGPAVAIGVGVTLIYTLVFTPALLACLGKWVFWPSDGIVRGSTDAKRNPGTARWEQTARVVTEKPGLVLGITLVLLLIPASQILRMKLSYDSVSELSEKSDARQGFEAIQKHFGSQETMPTQVLIRIPGGKIRSPKLLNAIYRLSDDLSMIKGVAQVRSVAWPNGKPEDLGPALVSKQLDLYSQGLYQAKEGLEKVRHGISRLQKGSNSLSSGFEAAGSALDNGLGGFGKAVDGAKAISDGLGQVSKGTALLENTLNDAAKRLDNHRLALGSVIRSTSSLRRDIEALSQAHPDLNDDPQYKDILIRLRDQAPANAKFYTELATTQVMLSEMRSGAAQLDNALVALHKGASQLAKGLSSAGGVDTSSIGGKLSQAIAALDQISSGLAATSSGLSRLESGVGTAASGLSGLGTSLSNWGLEQVYIPWNELSPKGRLAPALEYYVSQDQKVTKLYLLLKEEPFTTKAMAIMPTIKRSAVESMLRSGVKGADVYIIGSTEVVRTLKRLTDADFNRVSKAILLGIFLILALLLRSLVAPIYLLFTVILSYATSLGLSVILFQDILKLPGLSWVVPFFLFIFLVALGVDYNIFLMSRLREETLKSSHTEGVVVALTNTGGIITACGLIMAGTFAVLMTASLMNIIQLGFAVTVGILLDTFIVRTTLVPSIVTLFGRANWWPSKMSRK